MKILFHPKPALNIYQEPNDQTWGVVDLPARIELTSDAPTLPSGWVLVRGRMLCRSQNIRLRLVAEASAGESRFRSFHLPVTRKGKIHFIVQLPEHTVRLFIEPLCQSCRFSLEEFTIARMATVERTWRMLRRVVPVLLKAPRVRRHRVGLHVSAVITDLPQAYETATRHFHGRTEEIDYPSWCADFASLSGRDRAMIRRNMAGWPLSPFFTVVVPVTGDDTTETLASVRQQLYRNFEVILLSSSRPRTEQSLSRRHRARHVEYSFEESDSATVIPSGEKDHWLIWLLPGMTLAPHALYWLGHEIVEHRHAAFIYADHDTYDEKGNPAAPVFKPDWSPELLLAGNYIGPAFAVRSELFKSCGWQGSFSDPRAFQDLCLRATEGLFADHIRHIAAPLWHLPVEQSSLPVSSAQVEAHLQRLAITAAVEQTAEGHCRIHYGLPERLPLVSIIVPTRDGLSLLRACVESVLGRSTYAQIELLVIDNLSSDPQTLAYLQELEEHRKVRVLSYRHAFNYSAINNFAAQEASGEILCLLNNDTVVITPGWLEEMLGHLLQPKVGAVGAKLLYGDGRVQHGGVAVGPGGCANHLHHLLDRSDPGYCSRSILPQDLSAVTAACMLTWRNLFLEVGGLDQIHLPVAFNDVDYCLRLGEAGFRIVWTPYAELYHHESVSRGKDESAEAVKRARREVSYMRAQWKDVMRSDPFYNPNLSYEYPDFTLGKMPRIGKPWTA